MAPTDRADVLVVGGLREVDRRPGVAQGEFERFVATRCLTHHLDVGVCREFRTKAGAEQGVVICQKNAERPVHLMLLAPYQQTYEVGTCSTTRAP